MGYIHEDEEELESSVEFKAFLLTFQKFVENAKTKVEVEDYLKELIQKME